MEPQPRCVSVQLHNGILFFIPHYFEGRYSASVPDDAVYLPNTATAHEKGIAYGKAVQLIISPPPGPKPEWDPFIKMILPGPIDTASPSPDARSERDPFIKMMKERSQGTYAADTLHVFVHQHEDCTEFTPCEYFRGGFSGGPELRFDVPAGSSPEEIGLAIEKALSLCNTKPEEEEEKIDVSTKPQPRKLSVELHNGILYFIPNYIRDSIIPVSAYDEAIYLPNTASPCEKGIAYGKAVQLTGRPIVITPPPPDAKPERDPFLKMVKERTWGAYAVRTLHVFTFQYDDRIEFSPSEYSGGGFYGLGKLRFEISVDSSPEEIGLAIEKALSLCKGKKPKKK